MKVSRTAQPAPPPPPDVVTLEMTLADAKTLTLIAGYDRTIPNAIYSGGLDKTDPGYVEVNRLLITLHNALQAAKLYA